MKASPVFLKNMKNTVDRILHVPGNFTGPVLEMAVVIDHSLTGEQVKENLPELLRVLKMHSQVFRNVRLNVVDWKADGAVENRVCPMSVVMLESFYEDYIQRREKKSFEGLVEYLKMFQARAKLIILLTDGGYSVENEELLHQSMQPFLERKLMQLILAGDEIKISYR